MDDPQRWTSRQRLRQTGLSADTRCRRVTGERVRPCEPECPSDGKDQVNLYAAEPLVIAAAQALEGDRRDEAERLLKRLRTEYRLPLTFGQST